MQVILVNLCNGEFLFAVSMWCNTSRPVTAVDCNVDFVQKWGGVNEDGCVVLSCEQV